MTDKYILRITAGPDYDESTHVEVPVNRPETLCIKGDKADIELNLRIQDYKGLPRGSPTTSPYFSTEPHSTNVDQYSISFRFTPHKQAESIAGEEDAPGIKGTDLQFGNDFDRPIRDRLPPGFSTALSIVKWWIDPGLDGDPYADKPYLYGHALSSFNSMYVGEGHYDESKGGLWFTEGGDEAGLKTRSAIGMPDDNQARMKWGLKDGNKQKWVFEYGQTYGFDFYNPYLDFANLTLKLPGFHLPIGKYWDGQGLRDDNLKRSHQLRYVLRNKESDETYLVVVFNLLLKDDVNEDGTLKESAGASDVNAEHDDSIENDDHDEEKALKEARQQFGRTHSEIETSADDVD